MKPDQPDETPEGSQPENRSKFDAKSLLQSGFDFEDLGQKLRDRFKSDDHGKSPTTQLLDRIKQPLEDAVKAGMSLTQIHLFLVANKVRVSKPTLRVYLFGKRGKKRGKRIEQLRSNAQSAPSETPPENPAPTGQITKATPNRGRYSPDEKTSAKASKP